MTADDRLLVYVRHDMDCVMRAMVIVQEVDLDMATSVSEDMLSGDYDGHVSTFDVCRARGVRLPS